VNLPAQRRAPIALGCVTDVNGPYVEQAARLLLSLKWLGGCAADYPFILAVVGKLNAAQRDFFQRHEAIVVEVSVFDERHGPSNKLRFFELDLLDQFEHVALLDCDTVVVQDPSAWLNCDGFAAKPADMATVSGKSLTRYLEDQGICVPAEEFRYDIDDTMGLPYFNSGVMVLATRWRSRFIEAWKRYNRDLLERAAEFEITPFHVEQATLTAALLSEAIPIKALPSCMNFPAHLALDRYNQTMYATDPVIIHYHWLADSAGYLKKLPFPRVRARANVFNAHLRAARAKSVLPHPGAMPRGRKVIVATGWWSSSEQSQWRLGSDTTRSASFFALWYRQVMRSLKPEKIIVTDSAAPDKPDYAGFPRVEWVELDRNYGHANDIRTGKVKAHLCGWTRSVLNGATYALCCDADYFVYVEQDCLLRGENFLEAAIGDSEDDILLGARTQNGRGIEGRTAAQMFQNSLIVVSKNGLARFIKGMLDWEESDGELSPEVKLEKSCTPFGELAVPYGRSRPIDLSLDHFYAQHLTEHELAAFLSTEGVEERALANASIYDS